jgi:protein-disulfide isomerase
MLRARLPLISSPGEPGTEEPVVESNFTPSASAAIALHRFELPTVTEIRAGGRRTRSRPGESRTVRPLPQRDLVVASLLRLPEKEDPRSSGVLALVKSLTWRRCEPWPNRCRFTDQAVYVGSPAMTDLAVPVSAQEHVRGPADATVTLVQYADLQCPFCGFAETVLRKLRRDHGDRFRLVFRHFPVVEVHPHAQLAAQATEAAGAQGRFWEMHDLLLERRTALDHDHLIAYARELELDVARFHRDLDAGYGADRVAADVDSGRRSGVDATPKFFVNGTKLDLVANDMQQLMRTLASHVLAAPEVSRG